MDKIHKVITRLLKILTTSLDAEHLFLCPLFGLILDVEDIVVLFPESSLDGMKGRNKYHLEESSLEYLSAQISYNGKRQSNY